MDRLEMMMQRWNAAELIDSSTAERILAFEKQRTRGRRWPAILAVGFGTLMLCAGVLLFVAAHWDDISPGYRFSLVLFLVVVFHVAASLLGSKVPALDVALHFAGSASLGAGIFLAGQIFNLEEHWPGGLLLWALGAVVAWFILRQWPQALLASIIIPWWLGGEWDLAIEPYSHGWSIAAQGFLLLAIFYLSVPQEESNRPLRSGLMWVGCLSLIPLIGDVMWSGEGNNWNFQQRPALPVSLMVVGYVLAYLPVLGFATIARKKDSAWIFGAAGWVWILAMTSRQRSPEHNAWIYLWLALGACALCWWGVHKNRKLFINYGIVIFALAVITFYFSDVLDKLGRSMGLILLGVIFLAGGWVLHRLRTTLIARASAATGGGR